MAWSIVRKNALGQVPTWRGFICDTVADIATLPVIPAVAAGSECYCSENGGKYILETDGDWVLKSSGGGGGRGLPDVTSADNGKILRVVNGEWAIVDFPPAQAG